MEDGTHVSAETSARLACDASRTVMRHDEAGRIVEVAARNRTIPPALRRALQARDQGCRFPGCGSRFTEGHHIQHWARGGPTTLSNLALLCRRHHRAVHEKGFEIARGPDEALHFRRPGGELLPRSSRWRQCARGTPRSASASPRVPAFPSGWTNGWILPGRSMCCGRRPSGARWR
jgi:5-methylcytosine-specific restriction endonuclease McrA